MLRNTAVFYIFLLVEFDLDLSQGHKSAKKQKTKTKTNKQTNKQKQKKQTNKQPPPPPNFCASYLTKISIDLNGIWCTVDTRWCDEPHTLLILFIQY